MQLGMIGLGRMGGNIVRRLMRAGHSCVVYDKSDEAVRALAGEGAAPSHDLAEFVRQLDKPRAVWVMLPAGAITHGTIVELSGLLEPGDILIDGGNSYFHDDVAHAEMLREKGIRYLDVGTSGGVWGLERGYCMMIGGDKEAADHLDPIFAALAPGRGSIDATPRPRGARSARRAGLYVLRAGRRRALRQDGPQRHRIRDDAGLRRGVRHPAQRQFARRAGEPPLQARSRRYRRGLAARQRRVVLAAGPDRDRAGRAIRS